MANWYVYSGAAGTASGADWTNAKTTLTAAFTSAAAGDTIYVAHDHSESTAGAVTLTGNGTAAAPLRVICVNRAGSVPPVSADLRTTASVATTGANNISTANSYAYWYGIQMSAGSGANGAVVQILSGFAYMKSCLLKKAGTTALTGAISIGVTGAPAKSRIIFDNTQVQFGATGDSIRVQNGGFYWKNTASAVQGATLPTNLFDNSAGRTANALIEGVDLSALGSGKTLVGSNPNPSTYIFKDCKFGSSVTVSATPTAQGDAETVVIRSDSSGTNYIEQKYTYTGTMTDELVIVRTNGATDGTTAVSKKAVTTANSQWYAPFELTPIAVWNDVSGSSVTATIEGVWNAAALPNNDDIWMDVEYLANSGDPLGGFATGTKADILASGSALTASTQAWDSLVTARANSTAYSLGDVRKVASNPGRIFFCTTAGTSSGSEPAGYASAVDGGSVTDGTAVFRAAVRFKQSISFTAQQKGLIYAYVKAAKVSTTFYIDPYLTLS